jgi:hypothetical protein
MILRGNCASLCAETLPAALTAGSQDALGAETGGNESDKARLIEQVLELAGIKKQIEFIPAHMNAQLLQQEQKFDPHVYAELSRAVTESFQPSELYKTVYEYFQNNSSDSRLLEVLNWKFSPLFQKMSQLEIDASAPEAAEAMKAYFTNLPANPPSKERILLIQRLSDASGSSKLYMKIVLAVTRSLFKVTEPLVPVEFRQTNKKEFELMFEGMLQDFGASLENSVTAALLYTYNSVSDEELKKYTDFWESEAGRWFNKATSDSFLEAIRKATESAAGRVAGISTLYSSAGPGGQ